MAYLMEKFRKYIKAENLQIKGKVEVTKKAIILIMNMTLYINLIIINLFSKQVSLFPTE